MKFKIKWLRTDGKWILGLSSYSHDQAYYQAALWRQLFPFNRYEIVLA